MPPIACVFKVVFLFYLVLKVCFVKKPFYAVYRANKGLKTANEKIIKKICHYWLKIQAKKGIIVV